MRSLINSKSLTVVFGVSLFGVTGYLLYLLFKNEEDDDYGDTIPKTTSYSTAEISIPKDLVRVLIGRNGKHIKSIQEESNTRISFKDFDEAGDRMCIIRGEVEACRVAESIIHDFISNQPRLECIDMQVPQSSVARIIGRCGEQITEIISISGAKINVTDGDRSTPTRRVIIKGTKEQINVAKSYIDEIVERTQVLQSRMDSTLAKREPRLPLKPPSPKPPLESPRSERISPIPGQSESPFEVYVSAMVDPSHFWLQIVGPKATQLDQLVEEMTEYYGKQENRELHVLNSLAPGDLVAATFQFDNKWYRAEVLKVLDSVNTESQAELYYLDYGDTDIVSCKDVYELRTDLLRLHFQAIECYLARVEPRDDVWTEEAMDRFEEWTHVAQWKKLSARINGYTVRDKTRAKREGSPVPGVDLFDVEQDVDIAQELVNHGYATFKKDSDSKSASSRTTSASNNSVDSLT